jgi:hypothetical protein
VAFDPVLQVLQKLAVVQVDDRHARLRLDAELVEEGFGVPDSLGPPLGLRAKLEGRLAVCELDAKLTVRRVEGRDPLQRDGDPELAPEEELVGLEKRFALGTCVSEADSAAGFLPHPGESLARGDRG